METVNGVSLFLSTLLRQVIRIVCLSIFSFILLAGCAAPGQPTPPVPLIPAPISDLTAHQQGDGVQLTFALPDRTISGDHLVGAPTVEILRGSLKPDGTPDNKSFRVVYIIPGALVDKYSVGNHIQFSDPITADETHTHPGATLAYRVRTRASRKRASPDSNTVSISVFPVPKGITSLQATVTQSAIELSWQAPTLTSGGAVLSGVSSYHVYRGEIDASSAEAASHDIMEAKWESPLALLASSAVNSYRDTLFEFGKTYLYVVRSVIIADGSQIESDDSLPVVVNPRDIFPPAAPQNLVASVVVPPSGAPEVDLSWSINPETDLAGYRVYRSEQQGTRGELLTSILLLTPAYRDMSVQPGHSYWYTVTAVDRAGNESAPSAPSAAAITQP
jgi:uncharacterized protein